MANEIYANSMELACKAGSGKTICAMPDVCFTPPENPVTPPGVPVPYPNTGSASDTTEGSKTVKISGEEIMLKNNSYFKTSTGDEAGCAAKKGVISSKNTGKVYFIKWSMDVKFEGENVDRHLDMTTNNHGSPIANEAVPWVFMDGSVIKDMDEKCAEQSQKTQTCMENHIKRNTYKNKKTGSLLEGNKKVKVELTWDEIVKEDAGKNKFYNKTGATKDFCNDRSCKGQLVCNLVPFDFGCCDGKTPHHVVPAHCFLPAGERASGAGGRYPGTENYDDKKAPCICLEGGTKSEAGANGKIKEHGQVHEILDAAEDKHMHSEITIGPRGGITEKTHAGSWTFEEANEAGCHAVTTVKNRDKCDKKCMKKQIEAAHKQMGLDVGEGKSNTLMLRADSGGKHTPEGFVPKGAVSAPSAG